MPSEVIMEKGNDIATVTWHPMKQLPWKVGSHSRKLIT